MRRQIHAFTAALMLGALLGACVPSRDNLFDPVRAAVLQRTGVEPQWRDGWERPAKVQARVHELLGVPLTADSAALIAVLSSPRLQAVYAALAEAGGRVGTARALPNPQIDVDIVFPVGNGARRVELAAITDVSGLLGLLPRIEAGDAALRAVRRRATALTIDLIASAKMAFYEALAAERRLALRRVVAETAAASAELARSLHEAGNIPDFELTREEVFEEESQVALQAAEAATAAAREELNAVLGLSGEETGWRIAGALPDAPAAAPKIDDLEVASVTVSLELDASRWEIRAASADIGVARLESVLPGLGLGVAVHEEEDGWSAGPALRFALPIFNQGQGRRAGAWARLHRAQQQYTAEAIELRAEARRVGLQLRAAHARALRLQQTILPLREKLLDEAIQQYNAMNLSPFELITLRREHIHAEELYIDALRDYWMASAEAEQLRAGSTPRRTSRPELPGSQDPMGGAQLNEGD